MELTCEEQSLVQKLEKEHSDWRGWYRCFLFVGSIFMFTVVLWPLGAYFLAAGYREKREAKIRELLFKYMGRRTENV